MDQYAENSYEVKIFRSLLREDVFCHALEKGQ
jgi:hypothetical protein